LNSERPDGFELGRFDGTLLGKSDGTVLGLSESGDQNGIVDVNNTVLGRDDGTNEGVSDIRELDGIRLGRSDAFRFELGGVDGVGLG
jgi:hypothetical protein